MYAGQINIGFQSNDIKTLLNIVKDIDFYDIHDEKWTDEHSSLFIESFLARIPVPPFILHYLNDNSINIIYGKNRIKAIVRFLNDEYALIKTSYDHPWKNKKYSQLERQYQRRINESIVTIYGIYGNTPEDVVEDILKRWN